MFYSFLDYDVSFGDVPGGFDIAMLKLQTSFIYNNYVNFAYVAAVPNPPVNALLQAAGWGVTETGNVANELQMVSICQNGRHRCHIYLSH